MRCAHNCAGREILPLPLKGRAYPGPCPSVSVVGWKRGGFSMNSLKYLPFSGFEAVPRATEGCNVETQRCCSGAETSTVPPDLQQQHWEKSFRRCRRKEIHPCAPTSTGAAEPTLLLCCTASSGCISQPHPIPTTQKIPTILLAYFLAPEPLSWQKKRSIKPNKLNTKLP